MRTLLKGGGIFLTLALIAFFVYPRLPYTVHCVGLSDGDTLQVMRGDSHETIRLYGIDCPEGAQRWSAQARHFSASLVLNQDISIHPIEKDRYGRVVARVYAGSHCINEELTAAGLAWWYQRLAPNDGTLAQLENEARTAKKGLWRDKAPTAPWNWRFTAMVNYRFGPQTGKDGGTLLGSVPRQKDSDNPSPLSLEAPAQTTPENRIVYTRWADHHYHQKNCPYLDGTQIAIALHYATEKGYTPCEICNYQGP